MTPNLTGIGGHETKRADRIDPPLFCANGQKGDMFFRVLVPF